MTIWGSSSRDSLEFDQKFGENALAVFDRGSLPSSLLYGWELLPCLTSLRLFLTVDLFFLHCLISIVDFFNSEISTCGRNIRLSIFLTLRCVVSTHVNAASIPAAVIGWTGLLDWYSVPQDASATRFKSLKYFPNSCDRLRGALTDFSRPSSWSASAATSVFKKGRNLSSLTTFNFQLSSVTTNLLSLSLTWARLEREVSESHLLTALSRHF